MCLWAGQFDGALGQRLAGTRWKALPQTMPQGNIWIDDTLDLRKTDLLKHRVTFTGGNWSIEADDLEYQWEPL
jgi:hypothetical protein